MPSFSDLTLQTARLDLRLPVPGDADAIFAMRSDPVVQRYGSHPPWTDRQLAIDWIERNTQAMADGTHAQFAIVRREDAVVVGTCTLYGINAQCRSAEIGYALGVAHWGQGYAFEANVAMLDWGFRHLDLNRIEADIDPRNEASARSLRRLGFTQEGYLRERWIVDGEVSDTALFGLLLRDWRARQVAVPAAA